MRVNYIYKKESEKKYFSSKESTIELKEYIDDLIFYTPTNIANRAEFALYDPIAKYDQEPKIFTGGPFGSYIKINSPYKFDRNNFDSLNSNARISFYLGTNKITESPRISLKLKEKYEYVPAGSYSFVATVEGQPASTMTLKLSNNSDVATLKNKLLFVLNPAIYPFEINTANTETNTIVLQSSIPEKNIKLSKGLDGKNLLDYFDINAVEYGSSPTKETDIFKLFNLKITHFKNIDNGSGESYLRFTLISDELDEEGNNKKQIIEIPWNSDSIHLDNIEIDFDTNVVYIFINGKLKKVEVLDINFHQTEQGLELNGDSKNAYSFDEIIINKHYVHREDFMPDQNQLTKYTTKIPYIDYHFSIQDLRNGMSLNSVLENGIHCTLCEDGNYYYYNSGAWRSGDGTYSFSNDWSTFSEKIKEYEYTGSDLFIRCFFFSNGSDCAYLDVPYFEMDDETYEDSNGNTSAILIGTREWEENETEYMNGKTLIISTDQGTTTIEFNPENGIPMTIDEIIDYINSKYPDGISSAKKDSQGRAVLISESKGEDAYIKIDGDAAPIIFGETTSAKGSNANSGELSYDNFCKKIRTYTGEPLITMEISDEQIKLYLKEALQYYKRWRGDPVTSYTCQLKGNPEEGYEIPKVIEEQKDIIDILFKPVFPINFYGADLLDSSEDNIFTLTMANMIFGGNKDGGASGHGLAQDFYVSLMSLQDFKQTLGLNPSWEIINNRIFIFPANVARFTKVCIKYKGPISEEQAMNDPDIIKYVFGRCCLALGIIRGQYGSNLSVGEAALTFNADTLIELGKQYMKEAMDMFMSMQPPFGFILG